MKNKAPSKNYDLFDAKDHTLSMFHSLTNYRTNKKRYSDDSKGKLGSFCYLICTMGKSFLFSAIIQIFIVQGTWIY